MTALLLPLILPPAESPVAVARKRFPRGLVQPAGSFRCSVDALLLARFAAEGMRDASPLFFADLGTGCGVVGLALLLALADRHPALCGCGLELDPHLVAAARHNTVRLGLRGHFAVHRVDLCDAGRLEPWAGNCHRVLFNPPWRLEGAGRLPPSSVRRKALFGTPETLPLFAGAAARLLRPGGRAVCIVGAARLADLLAALSGAGLRPRRLRCVHTGPGQPARLVLAEASAPLPGRRPTSNLTDLIIEAPLESVTAFSTDAHM